MVSCCDVNGHECGEDPAVFRFMDGTSSYILNDEDKVVVIPGYTPVWISELISVRTGPSTRSHPGGRLDIYGLAEDGSKVHVHVVGFHDEFEREMFKEFLEENL